MNASTGAFLFGIGVLGLAVFGAQSGKKLEAGFQPLFNGKDLSGWHKNPAKIGHGTGGSWTVENGAIVGKQDPPGNGGILLSDREFGDFEVIIETKPDWGDDSGLFLRSTETGKGYQVMIDFHEDGNVGEIYREGLDGKGNRSFNLTGVYSDPEKKHLTDIKAGLLEKPQAEPLIDLSQWTKKIWKFNDWNTIRARIQGNPPTIDSWVNRHHVTHYVSDKKFEGVMGDKGRIAVQVHGGAKAWPEGTQVRFRNIRVKELN